MTMRLLSLAFLGLFFSVEFSHAQGGFSKFYHLPGSLNSTANDAMETPDHKYLVCGRTDTLVGGYIISRLTLMATDLAGNKLWTRSYGDLNLDYPDLLQRNRFYCAEQNHVYISCTGRDNIGRLFPVLTKINYDGDTIWQKRFLDLNANMWPQVLVKATDGGFYMAGYYFPNGSEQPVFLLRISSSGDLLWQKTINKAAPNVMGGTDMIQDSATRRLIITGYQYIGNGTYDNLLIVDSLGNKLSHNHFNTGCATGGTVIKLKDGNFLTTVQMAIDCQLSIFQTRVVKFDIAGKKIWEKPQNPFGPINFINPIVESGNGNWFAYSYLDSSAVQKLKLILFDSLGTVKRMRGFGRAKDVYDPDYIRAINRTSDGGFIVAMQANGEPSPTPFYIIKLDSMGCDTTPEYCEWERTVSLKEQKQTLQAEVFPNPCHDVLNVGVAREGLPATVNVFDQSGRKVLVQEVTTSKNSLDVSSLPDGFFLLEICSGTGVFRSNFVVQR